VGATIDGSVGTWWGTWGDQTITWTLGSSQPVKTAVISWRANSSQRTNFDFQTSSNNSTWTTQVSGSYTLPTGTQTVVLPAAPSAKYVRLVVHGDGSSDRYTAIAEVKFYSYDTTKPVQPPPPPVLGSVTMSGVPTDMVLDQTAALGYVVKDTTGKAMAAGSTSVTLASGDAGIVSVTPDGKVAAVGVGSTWVSVTGISNGVTEFARVAVNVTDPTRMRIYANGDTYVQGGGAAGTNYGSEWNLLVKAQADTGDPAYTRATYMSFDLSPLAGKTIRSAVLSLNASVTDSAGTDARLDAHATGAWTENGLTYNNRPTLNETVSSININQTSTYRSGDITGYVTQRAGQVMSLGITQDKLFNQWTGLTSMISSRESTAKPYIDITLTP
jgi:hypothetical protein